MRYSISGNTWANRATSPNVFSAGNVAAVWDGSDYIYAINGTNLNRYSISGNSWADPNLAEPPAGSLVGASLAYPGSGDFIYAFRGGDTASFYRYSISGNTWSDAAVADAPNTVGGGGSLVAPDTSTIYALSGTSDSGSGASTNFWSYSISGNSWTTLTGAPAAVSDGGSLAYVSNASGTFLYQLRGNTTTDFNRYTISLISTGGSAVGGLLLRSYDEQGALLARQTRPAAPTNVVVTPLPCNGLCGARIAFSYAPLPTHAGRPLTFAFIDEFGKTLGSVYEPFAGIKNYELPVKELPPNSPLNGRLCAQFGPGEGCVPLASWTLWSLDAAKVKLSAAPEGDRYRVRVNIPPFVNEGVELSGVRIAIEKNSPVKPVSVTSGRAPVAELAQVITAIGTRETITQTAPLLRTAVVAPRTTTNVIRILPLIQATPKKVSGGILVPSKSTLSPVPAKESLPGTLLQRSGEWVIILPPGEYRVVLTPINGKGVSGTPIALPLSLKPFGEALTLTAGMEAEDGVLRTMIDATANRLGNTGMDIITERKGGAFAFRPAEEPVEVRVSLVAALAKTEERFDFVFACEPGGDNCAVKSVAAQKGNIINRSATVKDREGFVTAKTDDAVATVRVTESATQASVSVTGTLQKLSIAESVRLGALHGGAGTLSVAAADALGNSAKLGDVAVRIPAGEAEITAFTVASVGDEGDLEAHAIIDYANFGEQGLLVNLALSDEGLGGLGGLEVAPKSAVIVALRDDGAKVRMRMECEAECAVTEAETIAPGEEVGEALEPELEETAEGALQYAAGGLTATFDSGSILPLLLGVQGEGGAFSRVDVRMRFASPGLGTFAAEFAANDARARATFFGAGKYVNLFPEVSLQQLLDLLPTLVYYPALKTAPPVIESVEGSRLVSESRPVLREVAEIGAPVSPLLNAIQNLFGGGQ